MVSSKLTDLYGKSAALAVNSKAPNRAKTLLDNAEVTKPQKKRAKVNAPEYVVKMELSSEKEPIAVELAKRFEKKAFLPTFGDIRNFCQIYEIDEPASKSRASAIPRVFKFIATMEAGEIQRILDDGMFFGSVAAWTYRGRDPAQRQSRPDLHPPASLRASSTCALRLGFYLGFTYTSKKADNGREGVSCKNEESIQRRFKREAVILASQSGATQRNMGPIL